MRALPRLRPFVLATAAAAVAEYRTAYVERVLPHCSGARVCALAAQVAVRQGAQLFVFPEYGITGFCDGDAGQRGTRTWTRRALRRRRLRVALVVNLMEAAAPGAQIYNVALAFETDGRLVVAKYRKQNLWHRLPYPCLKNIGSSPSAGASASSSAWTSSTSTPPTTCCVVASGTLQRPRREATSCRTPRAGAPPTASTSSWPTAARATYAHEPWASLRAAPTGFRVSVASVVDAAAPGFSGHYAAAAPPPESVRARSAVTSPSRREAAIAAFYIGVAEAWDYDHAQRWPAQFCAVLRSRRLTSAPQPPRLFAAMLWMTGHASEFIPGALTLRIGGRSGRLRSGDGRRAETFAFEGNVLKAEASGSRESLGAMILYGRPFVRD